MARAEPGISLKAAVAMLARLYPTGTPLTDPLSILVWDNIGYLIDDARRTDLFAEFGMRLKNEFTLPDK